MPEAREPRAAARTSAPARLAALQRWLQAVLTDAGGVSGGLASSAAGDALGPQAARADAVVRDLPGLSATESLAVYAGMYAERLREALALDYPALAELLGAERFDALARAYVATHPSRSKTLNQYGRDFAAWLGARAFDDAAAAADLARLERAIVDVRTAPDAELLSPDALAGLAGDALTELRLELVPALRLLELAHPVEACYRAWRRGEAHGFPAPTRSCVAVYRHQLRVWRVELSSAQHALLSGLASGLPLGAAIEAAAEVAGPEALGELGSWFATWGREGFFRALVASPKPEA